jgi:hypothetical protein
MKELPDSKLCVLYLPNHDCYVGRGKVNTTNKKSLARVFAHEAAAMDFYKRNGLTSLTEVKTIDKLDVKVPV